MHKECNSDASCKEQMSTARLWMPFGDTTRPGPSLGLARPRSEVQLPEAAALAQLGEGGGTLLRNGVAPQVEREALQRPREADEREGLGDRPPRRTARGGHTVLNS